DRRTSGLQRSCGWESRRAFASCRIGIDGVLWNIRRTLEVQAVAVGIGERGDPQTIADIWPRRRQASRDRIVIHGDGVAAHQADRHALADWAGGSSARPAILPVLLKHHGHTSQLEPTPTNPSLGRPLMRQREPEAVNIESKRR